MTMNKYYFTVYASGKAPALFAQSGEDLHIS